MITKSLFCMDARAAGYLGHHDFVNWVVGFNAGFTSFEQKEMLDWLATHASGRSESHDRPDLGPSGEVMFECREDALMCFLAFA